MEKKNIDWENLDFGYRQTDKRFVANYKDGEPERELKPLLDEDRKSTRLNSSH